jgi:hypothetical protein
MATKVTLALVVFAVFLSIVTHKVAADDPEPSLNTYLNKTQLNQLNNGAYIGQFFNYILTGSYNPKPSNNTALDELSIDDLLDVGFNQIGAPILSQQFPDNYFEIFDYVNEILKRLREKGTSSVKYKEIKQLFSNIIFNKFTFEINNP